MTKFIETSAGMISGPIGRVVTVNLDDMLSEDAARITRVILAALNDEFSDEKREACDLQATIDALISQASADAKHIVQLQEQLDERAKHGKEQAIEIARLKSKNEMLLSGLEAANKTVERVREALGYIVPRSIVGEAGGEILRSAPIPIKRDFQQTFKDICGQTIIGVGEAATPVFTEDMLREKPVTVVLHGTKTEITFNRGIVSSCVMGGNKPWIDKVLKAFADQKKALDDPR